MNLKEFELAFRVSNLISVFGSFRFKREVRTETTAHAHENVVSEAMHPEAQRVCGDSQLLGECFAEVDLVLLVVLIIFEVIKLRKQHSHEFTSPTISAN